MAVPDEARARHASRNGGLRARRLPAGPIRAGGGPLLLRQHLQVFTSAAGIGDKSSHLLLETLLPVELNS
eukprot:13394706-Alexandrium_andersonii.AAC.1